MMDNSFQIKIQDHFKLYVLLKDQIIFEAALHKEGIGFYNEIENQPNLVDGIRYFLLDKDRFKIDKIIIDNRIGANTETIGTYDYRDGQKIYKVYLLVAGIVVIIMMLFSSLV